jgi:hypothetical protein
VENKEANQLHKKYVILSLLLVFLSTIGLSLGQPANNTSATENNTTTTASLGPSLNYIWSITGIESGMISMVLNQDGQDLFGQAKYEPEGGQPWNADVMGSIIGDKVELILTAMKDEVQTTTKMSGIFAEESITGNYSQVSGGKIVGKGNFSAEWISPDVSSYTPATIEEPKVETPAPEQTIAAAVETTENQTAEQKDPKSRFVDVRQYADKIGPGGDLSGVPPGMGGSGGL